MTNATTDAILKAVQKRIEAMSGDGIVIDVTADDDAVEYLTKAAVTTDPALAAGYRKLAKKARRK